MYISYFDEAGDDGNPGSSPLFVLSSIYLHHQNWKDAYSKIYDFRSYLRKTYGLHLKTEIHTRQFMLNKGNYQNLGFNDQKRFAICKEFAEFIGGLPIKSIHVVINKTKIAKPDYDVLKNALTYNIQRIENDLLRTDPTTKFLMITDEGRLGKMRKISRRIQKINFIPSQFNPSAYRNEIKLMIEDPLPKQSNESYWIQIVDFLSYIVYLYETKEKGIPWAGRLKLTPIELDQIMELLNPIFNNKASASHKFGFVTYPK